MNIFNSISFEIIDQLKLSGHQFGFLSASYLLANVIFLIPAGMVLDHFSVKKTLTIATVIAGTLTLIFSQIRNLEEGILINFLIGICSTVSFLSPIKLVKQYFTEDRIALMTGFIIAFAMLGGILANTLFVPIAVKLGWRQVFIIIGIIGLLFALIEWLFISELEGNNENKNALLKGKTTSHVKILLAGIYNSLLNLLLPILGAEWGILYLMKIFDLTKAYAGIVISMLFIGMSMGSFLMGSLSGKYIQRTFLMVISSTASLILILILITINKLDFYALVSIFLLLGILCGTQTLGYSIVTELSPRNKLGLNMGIVAVIVMGGGTIMQPVFGFILDSCSVFFISIQLFSL